MQAGAHSQLFSFRTEKQIAIDIKEKLAYVAGDFNAEMTKSAQSLEKNYALPDGHVVRVGSGNFLVGSGNFSKNDSDALNHFSNRHFWGWTPLEYII